MIIHEMMTRRIRIMDHSNEFTENPPEQVLEINLKGTVKEVSDATILFCDRFNTNDNYSIVVEDFYSNTNHGYSKKFGK